jgi:hypothetical protein
MSRFEVFSARSSAVRIFKILDPPEQASVFTNAKKDALFAAAGRDDKL